VNRNVIDRIVNAVLYEGYVLYPYRASAIKNKKRWMFGGLYPPAWSAAQNGTDAAFMQTECLVAGDDATCVDIEMRFLHLLARGEGLDERQEAIERQVAMCGINLAEIHRQPKRMAFTFPGSHGIEGGVERTQEFIQGMVEVHAQPAGSQLWKLTAGSCNETPLEQVNAAAALMRCMASTHAVLDVRDGEFISLLAPPAELREIAAGCRNIGVWPVLAGENESHTMLASPIILYDYPQVAPESAGDFFDATEMDEMLTLRVMTLTEDEKREMRAGDDRARRILERTESLAPEHLMKLHGAIRGLRPAGGV
jgi:hypothetical protein